MLLLARGAGDWWEAMKREGKGVGEMFGGQPVRVALQPLALTVGDRQDSYRLAARVSPRFCTALCRKASPMIMKLPTLDVSCYCT